MNLCFYTLRWGTSIFIFSLCLVTCRLVCRLVFKIPCLCLLCKINNTASICTQNCKVEDDFAVELYFLVSVFHFIQHVKTICTRKMESPAYVWTRWSFATSRCSMRLFSCQKQCYYKALLSLCQIKKKLWFCLQELPFILWTELSLFEPVWRPPQPSLWPHDLRDGCCGASACMHETQGSIRTRRSRFDTAELLNSGAKSLLLIWITLRNVSASLTWL